MNNVTIWIDDRRIQALRGQSILEAADKAGIAIPTLCFHPAVRASGACRLCAVEIEGYRGLPAACSTEVSEGMRVNTHSPRVVDFRREMLLAILKEHPRECLACPRNGTCELQQLVKAVGIEFPYEMPAVPRQPVQPAGPYFERDYRLCVHCGRCVRVCHEVRGNRAIVFREVRGRQEVATQFGGSLEEAGCQFCGACVDVCPVGALREIAAGQEVSLRQETSALCGALTDIILTLYRKQLAHELKPSLCTLCSACCAMVFDMAGGKVLGVKPDPERGPNRGQACVQGRFLLKSHIHQGRLRSPALLKDGAMMASDWEEALSAAVSGLGRFGREEMIVVTDLAGSDQDLHVIKAFARDLLGATVYISDDHGYLECSRAMMEDLGPAGLKGPDEGLDGVDGMVVMGVNLAAVQPILSVAVREAALKGATLISANPLGISLGRVADMNLAYYPGSEETLLKGLLRLLLDHGVSSHSGIRLGKGSLDSIREGVSGYDAASVSRLTGVSEETLHEAGSLLGRMRKTAVIFGGGFMRSPSGREALRALEALACVLNGADRLPIIPVYGGPNVRGALKAGLFDNADKGPSAIPLTEGNGIPAEFPKEAKAAVVVIQNLSGKGSAGLKEWLKRLEFVVVMAEKEADIRADVVLPVASLLEAGGTVTDFMGAEREVSAVMDRFGSAKSVGDALKELAGRMSGKPVEAWLRPPGSGPSPEGGHRDLEWMPSPRNGAGALRQPDQPFALFSKESFIPYFMGPLLADEAARIFHGNGEVEMNPADAYSMGLRPGDRVTVAAEAGEASGTLGLNSLLARGTVAMAGELFGKGFRVPDERGPIFCKVAKAQS